MKFLLTSALFLVLCSTCNAKDAPAKEVFVGITFEHLRDHCKAQHKKVFSQGYCWAYVDAALSGYLAQHKGRCISAYPGGIQYALTILVGAADIYAYPKEANKAVEMLIDKVVICQ